MKGFTSTILVSPITEIKKTIQRHYYLTNLRVEEGLFGTNAFIPRNLRVGTCSRPPTSLFFLSPFPAMADINAIAKQFTDFYYTTFDTNRAGLQNLYVRQDL